MPIVGQLTTKVPTKFIMAFGWACLAFGMYYSAQRLNLLISFGAASRLRIAQAFGLGFLFAPISLSAYTGIPAEKGNSVAGLVNFMRNIGSSVGTSMVTTLLARRAQVHQSMLSAHANNYEPAFRDQLSGLAARLNHAGATVPDAQVQAFARSYQSVQIQSQTLAYIDTYMILAIAAGLMFLLSFVVRKNDPRAKALVVE
jgi:DHA2 family multidrug resistance protein